MPWLVQKTGEMNIYGLYLSVISQEPVMQLDEDNPWIYTEPKSVEN